MTLNCCHRSVKNAKMLGLLWGGGYVPTNVKSKPAPLHIMSSDMGKTVPQFHMDYITR